MPPGDPVKNIFALAFTQITGLQADIWTVVTGGVLVVFVLIGFDLVADALGRVVSDRATDADLKAARKLGDLSGRARSEGDEVMAEYYRKRASARVSRASRRGL